MKRACLINTNKNENLPASSAGKIFANASLWDLRNIRPYSKNYLRMKRSIYTWKTVSSFGTKIIVLLFLSVFSCFYKAGAQNTTAPTRTVIELKTDITDLWQKEEFKFYNYYSVVLWTANKFPKILGQNKINKSISNVKVVFNLEQNQPVDFFVTERPVTIDELYNIDVSGKETLFNLYLDPGDSLVINCRQHFYNRKYTGKGSENNPFYDSFNIDWPGTISNFSEEYINFWFFKVKGRYQEIKGELEKQKKTISKGCYNYLSTKCLYSFLWHKLSFIGEYITSHKDSSSVNYDNLYKHVEKLQNRILPELNFPGILNDSFIHIDAYLSFVDSYTSFQLALQTKTPYQHSHWDPDKLLFEIANKKLPPATKSYYTASIILQMLGSPDKKEAVKPYYEAYIKEYPHGKYTEGLTRAFNSRGNIAISKLAPDFTLADAEGRAISLSSFKGKTVCLYFHKNEYESPEEFPEIDKVLSSFPELIRVYIYSGPDTAYFYKSAKSFPDAVHLLNLNWAMAKEYNVNNIIWGTDNTFYIIGKDGTMVDIINVVGINEFEYKLYKLFNKAQASSKNNTTTLFIIAVIIGVLLISTGMSWLIIRWRARIISIREEKKRKLIEVELRGIRSQMNPHFIFNSLGSIQNLVNSFKVQEANLYLAKFAELMRLVLNNSDKSRIPVAEEIKAVRTYCELEHLRFDFIYHIEIDSKLDIYNTEIPGMLIQPYVENAILHGINNLECRKGRLLVKLELTDSLLKCTIDDNGIGRKAAEALKSEKIQKTNGLGLRLTKERIDLLNSQYQQKISVHITDKIDNQKNAEGTLVEIRFPLGD